MIGKAKLAVTSRSSVSLIGRSGLDETAANLIPKLWVRGKDLRSWPDLLRQGFLVARVPRAGICLYVSVDL